MSVLPLDEFLLRYVDIASLVLPHVPQHTLCALAYVSSRMRAVARRVRQDTLYLEDERGFTFSRSFNVVTGEIRPASPIAPFERRGRCRRLGGSLWYAAYPSLAVLQVPRDARIVLCGAPSQFLRTELPLEGVGREPARNLVALPYDLNKKWCLFVGRSLDAAHTQCQIVDGATGNQTAILHDGSLGGEIMCPVPSLLAHVTLGPTPYGVISIDILYMVLVHTDWAGRNLHTRDEIDQALWVEAERVLVVRRERRLWLVSFPRGSLKAEWRVLLPLVRVEGSVAVPSNFHYSHGSLFVYTWLHKCVCSFDLRSYVRRARERYLNRASHDYEQHNEVYVQRVMRQCEILAEVLPEITMMAIMCPHMLRANYRIINRGQYLALGRLLSTVDEGNILPHTPEFQNLGRCVTGDGSVQFVSLDGGRLIVVTGRNVRKQYALIDAVERRYIRNGAAFPARMGTKTVIPNWTN